MYDFETFELIILRNPLVDRALALHAPLYMYVLAYIPSGMSITSLGIENWPQERDFLTVT